MPLLIVRNDITQMKTDAIVNTANRLPIIGSGTDKAVYEKAGRDPLLALREKIGIIDIGCAAVTPALGLAAKYIIHAVGPRWQGGTYGEKALLEKCLRSILDAALAHGCSSVALPLISAGNFGFPRVLVMTIAQNVIAEYLETHDLLVYLVVFDQESYHLSEERFQGVQSYIDETYAETAAAWEYDESDWCAMREPIREQTREMMPPAECKSYGFLTKAGTSLTAAGASNSASGQKQRSLEDIVKELEMTFAETLFQYIDSRGLTDPEVYKRANLDRKLFSKIRKSKDYKPSKNTALALAIALRLNLDETKDFIAKAGYALTHSSKADIIIEYCIMQSEYDIFRVNEVLFAFDQPLLGSKVA